MALTEAEKQELAQLEAQYSNQPTSGLTPEEAAELAQLEAAEKRSSILDSAKINPVLEGTPLDYLAGLTRASVANVSDVAAGNTGKIATSKDLLSALKGRAPKTDTYLERAGVPEGYNLSEVIEGQLPGIYSDKPGLLQLRKGGKADPSMRAIGGFIGDVALDPMTYASGGLSAAAKLPNAGRMTKLANKVVNPLEELAQASGKYMYKSGLKRIDQEVAKYGKEPVSEVLMNEGIAGSADDILKQMRNLGDRLYLERQQILKDATKAGADVSMKEAMRPTLAKVEELRLSRDPNMQKLADALEADAKKYLDLDARAPEPTIRTLPQQGYQASGPYQEIKKINQPEAVLADLPIPAKIKSGPYQEIKKIVQPEERLGTLPVRSEKITINNASTKQELLDALSNRDQFIKQKPQVTYEVVPGEVKYGEVKPMNYDYQSPTTTYEVKPGSVEYGDVKPGEFYQAPEVPVYDFLPETMGPTPLQATKYKTSVASSLPDSAFRDMEMLKATQQAAKAQAGGLKTATENAVERALGPKAAAMLRQKNADLGKILTSRDKQMMEAAKEQNKNWFTSIDAPLVVANPGMAAAKKTADILKTTGLRTRFGRNLNDLGKMSGGSADVLARRTLWEMLRMEDPTLKETEGE